VRTGRERGISSSDPPPIGRWRLVRRERLGNGSGRPSHAKSPVAMDGGWRWGALPGKAVEEGGISSRDRISFVACTDGRAGRGVGRGPVNPATRRRRLIAPLQRASGPAQHSSLINQDAVPSALGASCRTRTNVAPLPELGVLYLDATVQLFPSVSTSQIGLFSFY
jgi:hypothetical protein